MGDELRGSGGKMQSRWTAAVCTTMFLFVLLASQMGARDPPIELQVRFMYPTGVRQDAKVTDVAGKQFTGELLQQDAFDVVIRTADGVQHSWPSRSVKVEVTDRLAKHLELLSKYTNADMHNLFAYLMTLQ
jgi:cytochrome c oxidase cbb3-type subunit III